MDDVLTLVEARMRDMRKYQKKDVSTAKLHHDFKIARRALLDLSSSLGRGNFGSEARTIERMVGELLSAESAL